MKAIDFNVPLSIEHLIEEAIKNCEDQLATLLGFRVGLKLITFDVTLTHVDIAEAVCRASGESWNKIISRNRKRILVAARQVYFYLCKNNTSLTLNLIGMPFKMHYSSVIHGIDQCKKHLETNDELVTGIITQAIEILSKKHHETKIVA